MMRWPKEHTWVRAWLCVAALGTCVNPAWALGDSDKEAVRTLSNEAAAEFKQEHFDVSLDKFMRAYELAKVPRLAVWIARTHAKLGQLVAAYEFYREALSLQPNALWKGDLQAQAQVDAKQELELLQARIAKLRIDVEGVGTDSVRLTVNDGPVPSALIGVERMVDPGQQVVVAQWGDETVTQRVSLAEGETKQIVMKRRQPARVPGAPVEQPTQPPAPVAKLASVPQRPNPTAVGRDAVPGSRPTPDGQAQRTAGWISVGVGAAGAALGVLTGIYVAAKHGDLDSKCPNGDCATRYRSEVETYQTIRSLCTASFVIGALGTASGLTLLLTSPSHDTSVGAALWLTPHTAGLRGEF